MKEKIKDQFNGNWLKFYSSFLKEPKKIGGDEFKANCPFHDDSNPSFNFSNQTGQYFCHGCQAKGDAFDFYAKTHGLNVTGDFPAVLEGIAANFNIPSEQRKEQRGKVVATYDYLDADGKLLFQVCRIEPGKNGKPKDFVQRRPDGNGWTWNLKGVEPVLYRLPQLKKADEVLIVEGEKDADNLVRLGFCATTCPMGAGKWRDRYTAALKGKNIVLIPDNDEAGQNHEKKVVPALNGNVNSLKILRLTGLPEGGDVSDFLSTFQDPDDAGEQLAILIDRAEPYTSEEAEEPELRFKVIHNAELLSNLKPLQWRIRDILEDKTFYYNFGDSGAFKTFIELDRLLCIAAGIDYHGHKVKQGPVLYVAGEGQQGIGRRILAWHSHHGTKPTETPFFLAETPTRLTEAGAVDDVRLTVDYLAQKYGELAAIQFDSLARNFGPGNENSTEDMGKAICNLDAAFGNRFCRGVNHHTGHNNKDRARGAYALHAAADAAYLIQLNPDGTVTVECKKMKDGPNAPKMQFRPVEIKLDIAGEYSTSYALDCIAEGDEVEGAGGQKNMSADQANAFKILQDLYAKYEKNLAESGRAGQMPSVSRKDWRDRCLAEGLYKRKDSFNRAIKRLNIKGYTKADETGNFIYPIEIYLKYNGQ
jgi:hypothetical protein